MNHLPGRHQWQRPRPDETSSPAALPCEETADGSVRIPLGKGDAALITAAGDRPDLRVRPVRPNAPAARWGLPT
ncbi:hypothetical protein ACFUN8_01180 [Streptomyces sp. NPDC057307]|uniref:hypothetical protein n=1 Tax=Streptomyces sp. NPDC057307 TaxID=3346096 RepID=UPI0036399987